MANIVFLSGGSGTRLWPLSNGVRAKQFLKVLRDEEGRPQSMAQRMVGQAMHELPGSRIVVATSSSQEALLRAQLTGSFECVVEPERRDTAPAIMLVGSYLAGPGGLSDDDAVVVCPIDSLVESGYFSRIAELERVVRTNEVDVALLGVVPSAPSSRYGYIVPKAPGTGDVPGSALPVEQFVEKPDERSAARLIERGALWNGGVFALRLGFLRRVTTERIGTFDYPEVLRRYGELPCNSFDYEVLERSSRLLVVAYRGAWKDLGTWGSLSAEMRDEASGNVVVDACEGVHVINELGMPMVVAGVRDAMVVASPDGILVADKARCADMKALAERASLGRSMCERRFWGTYRVLDQSLLPDGTYSLTKDLVIDEGCQISYQRHFRRREVWTVVYGTGTVVCEGKERVVAAGDVVNIALGTKHAVRATSDLRITEVQLGSEVSEDDIERFGYYWD